MASARVEGLIARRCVEAGCAGGAAAIPAPGFETAGRRRVQRPVRIQRVACRQPRRELARVQLDRHAAVDEFSRRNVVNATSLGRWSPAAELDRLVLVRIAQACGEHEPVRCGNVRLGIGGEAVRPVQERAIDLQPGRADRPVCRQVVDGDVLEDGLVVLVEPEKPANVAQATGEHRARGPDLLAPLGSILELGDCKTGLAAGDSGGVEVQRVVPAFVNAARDELEVDVAHPPVDRGQYAHRVRMIRP